MKKKVINITDEIYYNWHEEGGAIIKETEKGFELYAVPIYGGIGCLVGIYSTIDECKKNSGYMDII